MRAFPAKEIQPRAGEEVLKMAASGGAVATLEKPFSPKQLRTTIEPLLKLSPEKQSRGE